MVYSRTYSRVMTPHCFISIGAGEWPSNQTGGDNKAEDMPTLSPPQSPDVTVSLTESPRVTGNITSSLPLQSTRASDAPAATTQSKPLASVLPSIINMLNSPIKHSVALPTSPPKSVVSPLSSGVILTPAGVYPVPSSTPHHIPCLTDGDSDHRDPPTLTRQRSIAPSVWSVHDVCHFLCLNDCDSYCDSFRKKVRHSLEVFLWPKTIKKSTNSTRKKSQTQRARAYKVTSFLSTDCELSTETCSRFLYSLGPRSVGIA